MSGQIAMWMCLGFALLGSITAKNITAQNITDTTTMSATSSTTYAQNITDTTTMSATSSTTDANATTAPPTTAPPTTAPPTTAPPTTAPTTAAPGSVTVTTVVGTLAMSVANCTAFTGKAGVEVAVAAGIANASGVAASSVMVALSCPSRRLASGLLARRLADAVNAEYGITIPAGSTTISAASVTNAIVTEGATGLTSKIATAMTAANISGVNLTVTNVPEPTTTSTVSTTAAPSKQDSSARQVFTGSLAAVLAMAMAAFA
ncbi:unnamed protein product [Polarella glacialis]|uniref:Uncharacterized protein n=2 Tax=Polarella glacialis TaxID=89957 RepID=A0A813G5L0_POLGL|nr:unnamed protein product [Polarella glacialis]CAE8648381.1 unnamed protein product [Polarella glacialis]CAE8648382.1 unnamed protein product [Polarella glacialis]